MMMLNVLSRTAKQLDLGDDLVVNKAQDAQFMQKADPTQGSVMTVMRLF